MNWLYLGGIIVGLTALFLFHNGAYKSGANSEKVTWQAEKIVLLNQTNQKIIKLNTETREKEQNNIIKSNQIARNHRKEIANGEKERRILLADVRAGTVKWMQLASDNANSGVPTSETSPSGLVVYATEGSKLRRTTQYDLATLVFDANRNTIDLGKCQAQLLADRL